MAGLWQHGGTSGGAADSNNNTRLATEELSALRERTGTQHGEETGVTWHGHKSARIDRLALELALSLARSPTSEREASAGVNTHLLDVHPAVGDGVERPLLPGLLALAEVEDIPECVQAAR